MPADSRRSAAQTEKTNAMRALDARRGQRNCQGIGSSLQLRGRPVWMASTAPE
jgi:hypothetical protein